jgi:hypothetical protein
MNKEVETDVDNTTVEQNNFKEYKELKSIKYKTMLSSGISWPEKKSSSNLCDLDKFLENEKNNNSSEPWSKLDKTTKIRKLICFAENYKTENNLSEDEFDKLMTFLKDCLDRKKLQKVKDVIYDKLKGEVKDIPALFHNKPTNHFTLKNTEKHISTTRSLAPKNAKGSARGTAKNTVNYDSDTSI